MSLHKLTAGSGYDYLTRQVAALDATDKGHVGLASYYTEKGETPGVWVGAGLAGIEGVNAGEVVTADHMQNLFGAGHHPLATQRTKELDLRIGRPDAARVTEADYRAAARLGTPYKVYENDISPFRIEVARRLAAVNQAADLAGDWPVRADERSRIRTEVARDLFRAKHGREADDGSEGARELAATIAKNSRPKTTAVAGYDLTFSPVKSVSTLWALADPKTAATVERAHQAAIQDALHFLETSALFTRRGANGVRQVDVRGLVATAFTHRDSRAGDPDLHTHHAVTVSLVQYGRTRRDQAAATRRPLASPAGQTPYAVAPTTEWVRRMAAIEAAAASFAGHGRLPALLSGEHLPPPTDVSRMKRAVARWDLEAHRGLACSGWRDNMVLISRTQALVCGTAMVLVDAADASRRDPSPRLHHALGRAGAAWSDLGSRWDDLTTLNVRPSPELMLAAGEIRAATRELIHDAARLARPEVIAHRPGFREGLQAVLHGLEHADELALSVAEKASTVGLAGHARALSIRAHDDIEAGRVTTAHGEDTVWISPTDILAKNIVAAPPPVVDGLQASSQAVIRSATLAGAAAAATADAQPSVDDHTSSAIRGGRDLDYPGTSAAHERPAAPRGR